MRSVVFAGSAWPGLVVALLATPAFAQETTVPTRTIKVGETSMRVWTEGLEHRQPGKPVVVLEAGAGAGLETWRPVFAEIAKRAPVVAYDRRLKAPLSQLRPLHYAAGADPKNDLPGFVRAASAIRRAGARLVIVQDDVNALAIVDPHTGITRPLLLPAGPAGERVFDDLRGNKPLKLDLEACVRLPYGRLVAFGSGSSPLRERLVVLDLAREAVPRIVEATAFYAALRAQAVARRRLRC